MNARDRWWQVLIAAIFALLLIGRAVPAESLAYVADSNSDLVLVIDTQANIVVASIPVGRQPFGVAVAPSGNPLYVANRVGGTVSVIDTATQMSTGVVSGLNFPTNLAVTPDGSRVYVTSSGDNTVAVIDTTTNTIVSSINVGVQPIGIAITPDGQRAYVTNSSSNSVSAIDLTTNTVLTTIQVGCGPQGIAVTPDGGRVYVLNLCGGSVSVIDTATNTVEPGPGSLVDTFSPTGHANLPGVSVAFTPDGSRVYIPILANERFNFVGVVTTADNAPIVVLGVAPAVQQIDTLSVGIAITQDGGRAYLSSNGALTTPGRIIVVDLTTHTTLTTIAAVGPALAGIAVTPDQ
jgi:YVTN family beta-propeller protein